MSILRQALVILVIAVLGYGLWNAQELGLLRMMGLDDTAPAGTGADAALSPEEAGVPVTVAAVEASRDDRVVESIGTGLAPKSVTVYPSVSGEVTDVTFEAGDAVEAGQVLVRLDDRREQLALDLALVAVKDARQRLARFERASETGAVSASEVDDARTALDRARLERDQAEVELTDRTVRAPFDGHVGIPRIEAGDRVGPDTVLTTLDDRSAILVDFDVPEAYLNRMAPGREVRAEPWGLPGETITGTVTALASRIDERNRSLRLRARLPNEDDRLRPGMSFAVFVDLPGPRIASVPEVSVQWGRDGAYLWRIADGTAEKLFVTITRRVAGRVLVEGPIAPGDEIVVEGVQRMREGAAVSIVGRFEAPPAGGSSDAADGVDTGGS